MLFIFTLFFSILFVSQTNAEKTPKKLYWCQEDKETPEDKYRVKCYTKNQYQKLITENKCKQEIFTIEDYSLIFDDKLKIEDVEFECNQKHSYQMKFHGSFIGETNLKEENVNENRKNSTLKGYTAVANCATHECSEHCYQCKSGYKLHQYNEEKLHGND